MYSFNQIKRFFEKAVDLNCEFVDEDREGFFVAVRQHLYNVRCDMDENGNSIVLESMQEAIEFSIVFDDPDEAEFRYEGGVPNDANVVTRGCFAFIEDKCNENPQLAVALDGGVGG